MKAKGRAIGLLVVLLGGGCSVTSPPPPSPTAAATRPTESWLSRQVASRKYQLELQIAAEAATAARLGVLADFQRREAPAPETEAPFYLETLEFALNCALYADPWRRQRLENRLLQQGSAEVRGMRARVDSPLTPERTRADLAMLLKLIPPAELPPPAPELEELPRSEVLEKIALLHRAEWSDEPPALRLAERAAMHELIAAVAFRKDIFSLNLKREPDLAVIAWRETALSTAMALLRLGGAVAARHAVDSAADTRAMYRLALGAGILTAVRLAEAQWRLADWRGDRAGRLLAGTVMFAVLGVDLDDRAARTAALLRIHELELAPLPAPSDRATEAAAWLQENWRVNR